MMIAAADDKPKKSQKKEWTTEEVAKGPGKGVPPADAQREASPPIRPSPDLQESLEETGGSAGEQGAPAAGRGAGGGDRDKAEPTDRQASGRAAQEKYDDSGLPSPTMPDYGLYGGPMHLDRELRSGKAKDRKAAGKSSSTPSNPPTDRSEPPKDPDDRRGEDKRSDKV